MNNTLGKLITDWNGTIEAGVETNMQSFTSVEAFLSTFKTFSDDTHIKLLAKRENANSNVFVAQKQQISECESKQIYMITVKKYMTESASPGFDFMAKWNGNIPMPLRMMTGVITKATRGMVYMELHGDMYAEVMCTCMKCGKVLTNPVSQFFGIGPECGGHNYVHPFNSDEELKAAVEQYRSQLQQTKWEGWIPKSAITKMERV